MDIRCIDTVCDALKEIRIPFKLMKQKQGILIICSVDLEDLGADLSNYSGCGSGLIRHEVYILLNDNDSSLCVFSEICDASMGSISFEAINKLNFHNPCFKYVIEGDILGLRDRSCKLYIKYTVPYILRRFNKSIRPVTLEMFMGLVRAFKEFHK